MSTEIESIIEDLQQGFDELKEAVESVPSFTIEAASHRFDFSPYTQQKPPGNYDLVYMPNLTSRGPGSKRFRYIASIDSHLEVLKLGYLFATKSEAENAAAAIIEIFARAKK